jgi:hypothetical protein
MTALLSYACGSLRDSLSEIQSQWALPTTQPFRQRMPCEPLRLLRRCRPQLHLAHGRQSSCLCSPRGSSLSCSGLTVSTAACPLHVPPHGSPAGGGWARRAAPRGAERACAAAASRSRHAALAGDRGRRRSGARFLLVEVPTHCTSPLAPLAITPSFDPHRSPAHVHTLAVPQPRGTSGRPQHWPVEGVCASPCQQHPDRH